MHDGGTLRYVKEQCLAEHMTKGRRPYSRHPPTYSRHSAHLSTMDDDFDDSPILDMDREGGDFGAGSSTGKGADGKREPELKVDDERLELVDGFDNRKVWLVKVC